MPYLRVIIPIFLSSRPLCSFKFLKLLHGSFRKFSKLVWFSIARRKYILKIFQCHFQSYRFALSLLTTIPSFFPPSSTNLERFYGGRKKSTILSNSTKKLFGHICTIHQNYGYKQTSLNTRKPERTVWPNRNLGRRNSECPIGKIKHDKTFPL